MTTFINFECFNDSLPYFDLIIVGAGPAGITMVREMSDIGANVLLVESGALQEDEDHEALNAVTVVGDLENQDLQKARRAQHGGQLKYWDEQTQKFGVRCRVMGGSTAGWAGKVAPFDAIDYTKRDWIAESGWPLDMEHLSEFTKRAGEHLNLGPIFPSATFWREAGIKAPEKTEALNGISSFFWQFARSRHDMIDIMRFGPDFRKERHVNVTCLYNATVAEIVSDDMRVLGIKLCGTTLGLKTALFSAPHIVLASSAIENARLMLASKNSDGSPLGDGHAVVGRYLMDHPSVSIGDFEASCQNEVAALLGFFPLMKNHRMFMYSHGLAPDPELQKERGWPNLAVFAEMHLFSNDPLMALKRLGSRKSKNVFADVLSVVGNAGFVITAVGRRLLNSTKIPVSLRRSITDIAIRMDSNFVAREYQAKGRSRKLAKVSLRVISEQPPELENRITLSDTTNRLGMRIPEVHWNINDRMRLNIVDFATYIKAECDRVGITGLVLNPEVKTDAGRNLVIHDMAHTAGTTRMGHNPATSVVDANCQVHGVEGLYIAGASVFPTSGHANPTLMIIALTIRLSDHIRSRVMETRMSRLLAEKPSAGIM
jgi:choline dehydrogenase-like flavoprotein